MSTSRTALAVVVASLLSACAQGEGDGAITTGSILPAMPSLPAAPSLSGIIPQVGSEPKPRPPERVSGNLYRVYSGDRKLEDTIQRQNYALLRAAEGTRQVGGTHFIIVNGSDAADGTTSSALVRVMKLDAGAELPLGAVAADEIIHFFGPTFGRTDQSAPGTAPAVPQRQS